jgi:uncharacterized membrane protein YoaK (UPF0700 family)
MCVSWDSRRLTRFWCEAVTPTSFMVSARDFGRTSLLCLIGGSSDAIAFWRFGAFVGAMSGNTVLLGIDLAMMDFQQAAYHASLIAVFLIAVSIGRIQTLAQIDVAATFFFTAPLFLISGAIESRWGTLIAAAALGLQNSVVRRIGGVSVNTVFVTGDLVQLGSALPEANKPDQRRQLTIHTTALLSYAAGAVIGTAALRLMSEPMIIPAVLALAAAIEQISRPRGT